MNADAALADWENTIDYVAISLIGSVLICVHLRLSAFKFSSGARHSPIRKAGRTNVSLRTNSTPNRALIFGRLLKQRIDGLLTESRRAREDPQDQSQ